MSDVIEVMARALDDGDYPMATYRRDVIEVLEAAEKAGWRLVPVEPTKQMRKAWSELPHMECSFAEADWCQMVHAAPRPWEHDHG